MRTWQAIRSWFSRTVLPLRDPSACEVCDELEALWDLCCYAASQAVAAVKFIEWELGRLNLEKESRDGLLEAHSNLQAQITSLRPRIETLNTLLNRARKTRTLEESQTDRALAQRMVEELWNGGEIRELERAVKNFEQTSNGSEP